MARKEEIGKAAEKALPATECYTPLYGEIVAFKLGAEWADANPKNPWISVEDDLPCNHEEMINVYVENVELRTDRVLVMPDDGIMTIAYMYKFGRWSWHWSVTEKITHWMPIPKIPK